MRHIISLQLENESGALSRVAGLFSARGFNIESLTVAPTNDETLSRMTIVSIGDDNIIEQIVKQLTVRSFCLNASIKAGFKSCSFSTLMPICP
jgi:acetolactate synthase small subunit